MSAPADLLDPRQREAAALLMSAVDLPAPLPVVAHLWIEAARLSPGITVDQICLNSRRAALARVADLVARMLTEAGGRP